MTLMRRISFFLSLILCNIVVLANTATNTTTIFHPSWGIQTNYATGEIIHSAPRKTQQYGVQLQWFPEETTWQNNQIFIQAGFEHLSTNMTSPPPGNATSANDYAIGPLFRHYFTLSSTVLPYFVIGAQPGYFTTTTFGERKLGIYFEFRDTIGIGVLLGQKQQTALGLSFVHYSHLFGEPNNAINLPIEFSIAYQF